MPTRRELLPLSVIGLKFATHPVAYRTLDLAAAMSIWLQEPTYNYTQLVNNEAKKIKVADEDIRREILLWTQGNKPRIPIKPVTEESFPKDEIEARNILSQTFDLMAKSKNGSFLNAYNFGLPMFSSGNLGIRVFGHLHNTDGSELFSKTEPFEEDGKIKFVIKVSANIALNYSNSLNQAFAIDHELTHVKDMINFFASLPSTLSVQEKIDKWNEEVVRNPDERAKEEAKAYGEEARAYIISFALGNRSQIGYAEELYAAEFIRHGMNSQSEKWIEFIKSEKKVVH